MHRSSHTTHDEAAAAPPNRRETLYVLPALTAIRGPAGGFVLTRKFVEGAAEYAALWPGRVCVCIEQAAEPDSNLDHIEVHPSELPFDLRWLPKEPERIAELLGTPGTAAVVLASLVDKHAHLADMCKKLGVPLAYVCEYSLQTRKQIIRTETANPILRWRRERWTTSLERRLEHAVRLASGVQCNGTPTYEAYRSLNHNALLYFDTRVRTDQLVSPEALRIRAAELLGGAPLRLAFSGRLIAMKGADHLPLVAAELKKLGAPFTMDICGGGTLEKPMRAAIERLGLAATVRMRGVLDFKTELMPFVARNVDLFVCCHRQGDPSCTYLETMSCGTPIVGYDNEALRGLVHTSRVGWLSPLDQPVSLAHRIAALNRDRTALSKAALDSLTFASQHTFEKTMRSRIEHMLHFARSSQPSRVEAVAR